MRSSQAGLHRQEEAVRTASIEHATTGNRLAERLEWNGLRYTRIWSQHAPTRGRAGGGFDMPAEAIMRLARSATSIHIRLRGHPAESLTLKPGVVWPLQQLQRGLPFDQTLHGVDVTPPIARVTWHGPSHLVERMWNKGIAQHKKGATLHDVRLYLAAGNPGGLHLVAGHHCEFGSADEAAPVEVWLGEAP